jgi:GNAT superfamily N-acetyltransferase
MRADDLAAVMRIQEDAYSGHFLESAEVIAQRFALSSATSWVAERNEQVCAYLVCYWSKVGKVSPLNAPFELVEDADCLYLHDLALSKLAQGAGLSKLLISAAVDCAYSHSVRALALMSVQNSVNFWRKIGFSEFSELNEQQRHNLNTYVTGGEPAIYMVKQL